MKVDESFLGNSSHTHIMGYVLLMDIFLVQQVGDVVSLVLSYEANK